MKQLFRKHLLLFFLILGMCLVFTKKGYSQALVSVDFAQTDSFAVGEQITVNIQITDGQDVSGYELTVGFDPTALRYVESMNADYLPANAFVPRPVVYSETVHILATSGAEAASESEGTLATLTFEVVAIKASTLRLIDVILSDGDGMSLPVATKNGRITIIELPLIGDVNEDGKVNILDLTLVASNLTTEKPTPPRVDVNEDGTVNILDLVLVAEHLDVIGSRRGFDVRIIPVDPEEPTASPQVPRRMRDRRSTFRRKNRQFRRSTVPSTQPSTTKTSKPFRTPLRPVPLYSELSLLETSLCL